ncbi:MAG: CoA-binding protein [Aestuariivirga sp.]
MNHDDYPLEYPRDMLKKVKTIAMVGASPNPARPSHGVMRFLLARGFHVIPINPGQAGREILGQKAYATLADVPEPIDMVEIFRASDAVAEVVDQALSLSPKPKVIWMQLGVRNDAAAAAAEVEGIDVVMNRCPAIELR